MGHLLRTRFAGDIIAEFLPPKKPSNKVIILASGMPGMPSAKRAMHEMAKRGYWVFLPRYRGTWESGGTFLDHSPHEDILDVVDGGSQTFTSIWTDETFEIAHPEVYIVGTSFGGPAAILCSLDARVKKAVAIAPVTDWRAEKVNPLEPMDWLGNITRRSFGEAYRFSDKNWNRLADGHLYNPIDHIADLDAQKLMLVHAEDDDVVQYEPAKQFAKDVGCEFVSVKKGGHLGSSCVRRWGIGRKIWKFLNM